MFDPKSLIIDNPQEGVFRVHRSAMTSMEERRWVTQSTSVASGHWRSRWE